jgi:hypothetical protein
LVAGRVEVLALVALWLEIAVQQRDHGADCTVGRQLSWWTRPVARSRKPMIGSLDGTKYDERSISPAPVNALSWR